MMMPGPEKVPTLPVMTATQTLATRPTLDRALSGLVSRIQAGECVLVLGPRISAPCIPNGADVPLADDLANKLVEALDGRCDTPLSFRRAIVRYERERSPQACRSLVQQLVGEYDGNPTPLHLDLAKLPFELVLCATHDTLMHAALRQVGKLDARESYYDAQPRPGRVEPLGLPTIQSPIVYSLFGRHDHPESMVLNEQNLLDYLVSVTRERPALPDAVRSKLRDPATVFLFIGFGFENWWLRLLLKVLEVTGVKTRGESHALEESRAFEDQLLNENRDFFGSAGIVIRAGDWNELAKNLLDRVGPALVAAQASATQPGLAQNRPKVFLSYASEDRLLVDGLRESLIARGLNVWQDASNLRAGELWMDQIERVINGVDFFVFFQTEQMDRRDADRRPGVYHEELSLALKGSRRKLYGTTFVIHVTVGSCRARPEPEMRAIHHIAIDDAVGVDRLAAAMQEAFAEPPAS